LEIGDNGVGMAGADEGFGLSSIRERAALLGGEVSVMESAGPGSRLLFSMPLDRSRV
jgi:two-component system sensor histidine kinase UhpB